MNIKRFACVILAIPYLFSACASETVVNEPSYPPPWQIMPTDVDSKIRQEYMQKIEDQLILFHRVILDAKTYHPKSKFDGLTKEVHKYIHLFVNPIFTDTNQDKNIEDDVVIAKLYFLVILIYSNIDSEKQARKYLELFHERYDNQKNISELPLNYININYHTLGEGIKELEKKVNYSSYIVSQ